MSITDLKIVNKNCNESKEINAHLPFKQRFAEEKKNYSNAEIQSLIHPENPAEYDEEAGKENQ